MNRVRPWVWPFLAALVVTILNAAKPVVVDDTAYLFHARHLAQQPLQPYAFELFWYHQPDQAMDILLPPVLPYWLALGMKLFGENVVLLKLWLFPFVWLLAVAARSLFRRFLPFDSLAPSIAFLFSPIVLPMVNVMLDVPALALGLAGVAVFLNHAELPRWWKVLLAGALCGLAMQTKYTMLFTPVLFLLYACCKSWKLVIPALLAMVVAYGLFAAWEYFVYAQAGQSHFLRHAAEQGAGGSLFDKIRAKLAVAKQNSPALLSQSGLLLGGWAMWAMASCTWTPTLRKLSLGLCIFGIVFGIITLGGTMVLSASDAVILPGNNGGAPRLEWPTLFGVGTALQATLTLITLTFLGFSILPNRSTLVFLFGWVLLECASTALLSPFPAGRRVMGVATAFSFLAMFLSVRLSRYGTVPVVRRWPVWVVVASGLLLFTVDAWDTRAEKEAIAKANEFIPVVDGEQVWFNGHWGFQYYADRAGMMPVVPNRSVLLKGDWLVFPEIPDDSGFYRPYHGGAKFRIDVAHCKSVTEFVIDDPLRATTIPTLYGGTAPIRGRDHPRLKIVIYRITADWHPTYAR
jgi:Dolichyl-phosphate-mannose-protein mannosyltransferase